MKLQLIAVKMTGKIVEEFKLADISNPARTVTGIVEKGATVKAEWFNRTAVADMIVNKGIDVIGIEIQGLSIEGSNGAFVRYANLNEQKEKYPLVVFERVNINGVDGCTVIDINGRLLTVNMPTLVKYAEAFGIANGKVVGHNNIKFISSIKGEYKRIGVTAVYEQNLGPKIVEQDDIQLTTKIKHSNKSPYYWAEGAKLRDEKLNLTIEEKLIISFKSIQNWNFFMYSILTSLDIIPVNPTQMDIPTMCVTGNMCLEYNPLFVLDLTLPELIGCLLHETYHILFSHPVRIKQLILYNKRHPEEVKLPLQQQVHLYNIAADLFVNKYTADQFNSLAYRFCNFGHVVSTTDPFVTNRQVVNWKRGVKQVKLISDAVYNDNVDLHKDSLETLFKDLLEKERRDHEEQKQQEKQSQNGEEQREQSGEQSEQDGQDGQDGSSQNQQDESNEQEQSRQTEQSCQSQQSSESEGQSQQSEQEQSSESEGQSQQSGGSSEEQSGSSDEQNNEQDDTLEQKQSSSNSDTDSTTSNTEYNSKSSTNMADTEGQPTKAGGNSNDKSLSDEHSNDKNSTSDNKEELNNEDADKFLDQLKPRNLDDRQEEITGKLSSYKEQLEKLGSDLNSEDDTESNEQSIEELMQELKNYQEKLKNTVLKAEAASNSRGYNLSEAERRIIDNIIKPVPINWKVLVKQMFNMVAQKASSYKRPSRRPEIGHNVILPGKAYKEPEGLEKIVFAIDTSGSVDDKALRYVLGTIRTLANQYKIDVDIVWWSTMVNGIEHIKNVRDLSRAYNNVASDGGTCATNMFQFISSKQGRYHGKQIHGLIIFTDGEIDSVNTKYRHTAKHILWMIHSSSPGSFKAPFGTTAYIDVDNY